MNFPLLNSSRRKGFSLIELLVVVAIMLTILGFATPVVSSLTGSGTFNRNVAKVTGLLDQARQYAITQNTYVWVAFHQGTPGGGSLDEQVAVAVIASKDGTNPVGWAGSQQVPSAQLDMVNKLEWMPATRLALTSAMNAAFSQDNQPNASGVRLADGVEFLIKKPGGGGTISFDQVILFSPRGEARVGASPVSYTDFALQPVKGQSGDANNFAIIQSSGLTGTTRVYRQ